MSIISVIYFLILEPLRFGGSGLKWKLNLANSLKPIFDKPTLFFPGFCEDMLNYFPQ